MKATGTQCSAQGCVSEATGCWLYAVDYISPPVPSSLLGWVGGGAGCSILAALTQPTSSEAHEYCKVVASTPERQIVADYKCFMVQDTRGRKNVFIEPFF